MYTACRFNKVTKINDGTYRFHLQNILPLVMHDTDSCTVESVSQNIKGLDFDRLSLWFTYKITKNGIKK